MKSKPWFEPPTVLALRQRNTKYCVHDLLWQHQNCKPQLTENSDNTFSISACLLSLYTLPFAAVIIPTQSVHKSRIKEQRLTNDNSICITVKEL